MQAGQKVRLRHALALFDELPEKTRGDFRDIPEAMLPDLRFGFGLFLRNELLRGNALGLLTRELWLVKQAMDGGEADVNLSAIEREAPVGEPSSEDPDTISMRLIEILHARARGRVRIDDVR